MKKRIVLTAVIFCMIPLFAQADNIDAAMRSAVTKKVVQDHQSSHAGRVRSPNQSTSGNSSASSSGSTGSSSGSGGSSGNSGSGVSHQNGAPHPTQVQELKKKKQQQPAHSASHH